MGNSIAHPTDFSPEGLAAFEHALCLALVNRCPLDLLHVHSPDNGNDWDRFPHVRKTLQRWGILQPGASTEDVFEVTGVAVRKVEISHNEAGDGLARFLRDHRPGLIVMASHRRAGFNRWLNGSVSTGVARVTNVPTLIFGPLARPFVDSLTGRLRLETILVPVDHDPAPQAAVLLLKSFVEGLDVALDFLHVGPDVPALLDRQREPLSVRRVDGPVIETLLDQARQASMIAMPMAGRHGLLDTIRGSTTERVVHDVTCPVLALPAAVQPDAGAASARAAA
jgi:nucleotide-binding universal stress UspA family protein